mgnify:CR=1 FL=1
MNFQKIDACLCKESNEGKIDENIVIKSYVDIYSFVYLHSALGEYITYVYIIYGSKQYLIIDRYEILHENYTIKYTE